MVLSCGTCLHREYLSSRGVSNGTNIKLRISQPDVDALKVLASQNERTMAGEIRLAIRDYLAKQA